jgi:DNA polymerase
VPEPEPLSHPDDLARQVRQVLDSLRLAGVAYVPDAAPPAPAGRQPLPTVTPAPATLFAPAPPAKAEGSASDGVEERLAGLRALAVRVAECQRCAALASTRTQTVFGVGPLDPDLCIVGEAPGRDEDQQGEPFVGAAGQLLNRILAACGLKREEVFICNILRCRPPGNRKPEPAEARNCREFLDRTLELVRPRFLCCMGGTAANHLLGTTAGITKMRGKFYDYHGTPVMCTYHPSYLLRSQGTADEMTRKREVWEDMKKLLARMGRPVP